MVRYANRLVEFSLTWWFFRILDGRGWEVSPGVSVTQFGVLETW